MKLKFKVGDLVFVRPCPQDRTEALLPVFEPFSGVVTEAIPGRIYPYTIEEHDGFEHLIAENEVYTSRQALN